jgi:hypothetical protein
MKVHHRFPRRSRSALIAVPMALIALLALAPGAPAGETVTPPESTAEPKAAAPEAAKPSQQVVPPVCGDCGMRGCGCGEPVGNEPRRPAGCGCMQRKLGGQ